jgi:hypothetical protein
MSTSPPTLNIALLGRLTEPPQILPAEILASKVP